MQNKKIYNQAFTLVELIVVITILAILGTIAFISFQGYSSNARDSVRMSDMNNINKGLALFQLKGGTYPKPDNSVTISASGTIIGYEGTVGENVSRIINTNKVITDPLDNTPYVYYTNATNTTYQLLGYLEGNSLTQNNLINTTYAATDYTKRYPKVLGNNLGILLDTSNNPITTNIDLFQSQSGTTYNSYISNATIKTLSGVELGGPLITLSKSLNFEGPTTCPEGFIKVPGNEEFMQPGFCVAKYEMTYTDADTPNTCDGSCPIGENTVNQTDWNTVTYTGVKIPVSMAGKYPIADINQTQAIDACKSMGEGYHLITNNEWMTIARDIEANQVNWSGNAVGSGYIYNGVSDSYMGCGDTTNTKTIYASLTRGWVTKTGGGLGNTACDTKRQLQLSNGEIIWDLAGNVQEHVNKANTIDGSLYATGTNRDPCSAVDRYYNWNECIDKSFGPSNPTWNYLQGMGGVWDYDGTVFLRGAGASNQDYVGGFALNLSWSAGQISRTVGFRCGR
ncbi:MAG: type II secretion system protein [Candidatus Gracilibacteria bacterium]